MVQTQFDVAYFFTLVSTFFCRRCLNNFVLSFFNINLDFIGQSNIFSHTIWMVLLSFEK